MSCKKCGRDLPIVNKHFGLCRECNNERLHGSKYGKPIKHSTKKKRVKRRSLSAPDKKNGEKIQYVFGGRRAGKSMAAMRALDEIFYEECFNKSDHTCEECGAKLPEEFRDHEGNVIARFRYSHIIPKSIAPELRHDLRNINDLCFLCHQEWDFGEKTKMKIYKKNQEVFPQYLNK